MDTKHVERISKALGDPHRIKILQAVSEEKWMQCADVCAIIDLTQSAVSHHIKQLIDAGILLSEKEGRNIKYTVDKKVVAAYIKFLQEIKG
jgi:ArsR family transcriptional regulator